MMKPKDKVVSAHDVESSLYYCHLTQDEDIALLDRDSDPHQYMNTEDHGIKESILRLHNPQEQAPPLPSRTSFPQKLQLDIPQQESELLKAQTRKHIKRKPVQQPVLTSIENLSIRSAPQRKLLGPRPLNSTSEVARVDASHEPQRELVPPFTDRTQYQEPMISNTDATRASNTPKTSSQNHIAISAGKHLTLIRRNPATGDQWNIGKIALRQSSTPMRSRASPKRRNRNVELELQAPGYTKFINTSDPYPTTLKIDLNLSASIAGFGENSLTSSVPPSAQNFAFTSPWRTPCMFNTAASGRVLKCYHALGTTSPSLQVESGNQTQSMLVSELRFNLPTIEKNVAKKKENRRPQSYSSISETRIGLKSTSPTKSTAWSANSLSRHDLEKPGHPKLPPRPISYQGISRPASSTHTTANPTLPRHQAQPYLEEDGDEFGESELDLSLGQERAGGGFSGNKAKLGKLIIYGGQGLAMLDLLVSANMGVWFNDLLKP